jgi:hypothetical protein
MTGYEENDFVLFLYDRFRKEDVDQIIDLYKLGSSNRIRGSVIFWYTDKDGKTRSGKVMRYDRLTGKRVKEGNNKIHWVHTLEKMNDFQFRPCLFGEHLLRTNHGKPVAIVESEKTAIICSLSLPHFAWLATGGIQNFRDELLRVLKYRKVVAFPDLRGYDKWKSIANSQNAVSNLVVSDYLEKIASQEEREQKLDIADFLLKTNSCF